MAEEAAQSVRADTPDADLAGASHADGKGKEEGSPDAGKAAAVAVGTWAVHVGIEAAAVVVVVVVVVVVATFPARLPLAPGPAST